MKSKAMLPTSIIMTVLMIGLISSPMVTKTYATDYNGYNSYGGEMPYNGYKDYNKVKIFPPPGMLTAK